MKSTSNPAISIVVPIYNQEKYIEKCITSVIGQGFKDIELILVNDGSTDNSLSICQHYANNDNRIVIINKENEGVTKARKDGFLHATGKYVSFIDSDDYFAPHALETLYKIASDHNADLVIGNHDRVYDKKGIIKQGAKPFSITTEELLDNNMFLTRILGLKDSGRENSWGTYMWGRLIRLDVVRNAYAENADVLFPSYTKSALIEDMAFDLAISPYLDKVWLTNKVVLHYRYGGATSRDFPIVRCGGSYFDSRYDSCVKYNYNELLYNVFVHYCACLSLDVRFQIHFKNNYDSILNFICDEFKTRKIVSWIRNSNINYQLSDFQKAVVNNNPTEIIELCSEKDKSMRTHYLMKELINYYQKLIEKIC